MRAFLSSITLLVAAAMFQAGSVGLAYACSCAQQTESEAFDGADAVFVGVALSMVDGDPITWDFAVESVQKGTVSYRQPVAVSRAMAEDCMFGFGEGVTYQVYAGTADQTLTTDVCSGTHAIMGGSAAYAPDGLSEPSGTPPTSAATEPSPPGGSEASRATATTMPASDVSETLSATVASEDANAGSIWPAGTILVVGVVLVLTVGSLAARRRRRV